MCDGRHGAWGAGWAAEGGRGHTYFGVLVNHRVKPDHGSYGTVLAVMLLQPLPDLYVLWNAEDGGVTA